MAELSDEQEGSDTEQRTASDDGEQKGEPDDALGAHVKRLREARGLTQDELAALSGLAADTIRRLEHEDFSPSLRTLKRLSRGLGITMTALFASHEMREFEYAREFDGLLATRPLAEQREFARLWREIAVWIEARSTGKPEPGTDDEPGEAIRDPFGRHVRSLRRVRGLTQEQLAEACGLSPDTIRRLEHGAMSPGLETLTKLCAGLQLRRSTLFLSFEGEETGHEREFADMLHGRPEGERRLVLFAVRVVLGVVDSV